MKFSLQQIKQIFRYYRTSTKYYLELTSVLNEVIIGSMLGDLTAEKRNKSSNTRLHFKQSAKNSIYIEHLFLLFQEYCGSRPKTLLYFDSRPNKMETYKSIKFQTFSLPCFNIYRELFYDSNGIKIIPANLENLLTARSLAYWVMDDGYKFNKGLYLSTESFSKDENKFLQELLKNKFNLDSGIHRYSNGHRLYIFSSSRDKLKELIKPYFLNHFLYKLS